MERRREKRQKGGGNNGGQTEGGKVMVGVTYLTSWRKFTGTCLLVKAWMRCGSSVSICRADTRAFLAS